MGLACTDMARPPRVRTSPGGVVPNRSSFGAPACGGGKFSARRRACPAPRSALLDNVQIRSNDSERAQTRENGARAGIAMTDQIPPAGRLRGLWRPETGIFLAFWLLLLAGGRSRFFHDPGTFWHTVVGQYLLERGELLRTDPFSFTPAGRPWIAWQWVGEAAMAALHAVARFDAILLATAT